MDLHIILTLGNYAFTAGAYIFAWKIYVMLHNHERTKMRNHLTGDCGEDCYYCGE